MRGGTVPQPIFCAHLSETVAGSVKVPLNHDEKDENAPDDWDDERFMSCELDTAEMA
jgi:hypothetical protein